MLSAISAIRSRFAISSQDEAGFSMMRSADASRSASGSGGDDEVSYAGLDEKDKGLSLDMMKESLNYDYSKHEADSDKKQK